METTKFAKVLGKRTGLLNIKRKHPGLLNLKRKQAAHDGTTLSQGALGGSLHQLVKRRKLGELRSSGGITFHSGTSISANYTNYLKSGLPQRLMFYEEGEWVDYPQDVLVTIKKDLQLKRAVAEIQINESHFLLDFLHMLQVDLETGLQQPIAWIDEAGHCFFPESVADYSPSHRMHSKKNVEVVPETQSDGIKLQIDIAIDRADILKMMESSGESDAIVKEIQVHQNFNVEDAEYSSTKEANVNVNRNIGEGHDEKLVARDALLENLDSERVTELFYKGIGLPEGAKVIEVMHDTCLFKEARFELFRKQVEITEKHRGNANVRYAWLPVSKEMSASVMKYGFNCVKESNVKPLRGYGVNLIPADRTDLSAKYSDIDEKGVRHLLFCRVIMGNMELVPLGSSQFHPSSEEFDNGTDDVQNPKRFIVWHMNMNSHIFPEYVVSYKIPSEGGLYGCFGSAKVQAEGCHHASVGMPKEQEQVNLAPKSPFMPFSMLFAALADKIPEKAMTHVRANFGVFQEKKMSRDDFIRVLRMTVGDNLLKSLISGLYYKKPVNMASPKSEVVDMVPEADKQSGGLVSHANFRG